MTTPEPQGAYFTQREIFDEVRAVRTDVGRVLEVLSVQKEDLKDHEERLRVVEKKVWAASGVAALLGGGGATMLQLILTKGA